jgi:hypothetical protein
VARHDPKDIMVTVDHPFGSIEVPLVEWIAIGPGPRRLVRPVAARSRSTDAALPPSVIPLRYRNSALSRSLIAIGVIKDPWPSTSR